MDTKTATAHFCSTCYYFFSKSGIYNHCVRDQEICVKIERLLSKSGDMAAVNKIHVVTKLRKACMGTSSSSHTVLATMH